MIFNLNSSQPTNWSPLVSILFMPQQWVGGEDVVVSTQAKLSVGLSWFLRLFEELRDKMIETLNKGLIKGKLNPL